MSEENNSLDNISFQYILTNFLYSINKSLFYAFIIQIILVAYGYFRVGRNAYWRVLYISSWCGLVGSIIENICIAWTEHPNNTNRYIYLLYIINEPFWIVSEFTIPYVNMMKVSVLIMKKKKTMLNIYISILFILFVVFRIKIGILRYKEKEVFNDIIYRAHGYSFLTMAVAELSCTLLLIKSLTIDYEIAKRKGHNGNIFNYSKRSSYFILLVIDICGFILAILSMLSDYTVKAFLVLFHCLKSNFVLILAVDALILKIENIDNKSPHFHSASSSNIFSSTNDNYPEPSKRDDSIGSEATSKEEDLKTIYRTTSEDKRASRLKSLILNTKKIIIVKNDESKPDDDDDSSEEDISILKNRDINLWKEKVQSNSTIENKYYDDFNKRRSAASIPDNHKYYERFNNMNSSMSFSENTCSSPSMYKNVNKYNMHSEVIIRNNLDLC